MSKNRLFTIFSALLSLALFSSYSSGPPGDYSGSPVSNGTCSACHGGGTLNGSLALTSNIGAAYVHGQTYQITVYLSDPEMVQGGFQLSALDDTNTGVGTFTPIANTALLNGSSDPTIINHSSPKPKTTIGSTNVVSWIINWTAPTSGSEPISFYAVGNAGNGGGSGGDAIYTATILNTPLPIEILDFSVKNVQNKAFLAWKTGVQSNFSHFEVEKSIDGKHFISIGRVDLDKKNPNYSFTDAENLGEDVSFYRLKSVDKDTRFEYSKIVSFKNTNKKDLAIFPIPAQNVLNIKGETNTENAVIFDFSGRVYSYEINNNQLDISDLENGNYTVLLNGNVWKKFSVLK